MGVRVNFAKVNDEQRLVYGWASVVKQNGKPVVDWQDDVIPVAELQKAAHLYVQKARVGKRMHGGGQVADLVESFVVAKDSSFGALLKALDIEMPDPLPVEGWWVGFKVNDDNTWDAIKKGKLRAFSIGGGGKRVKVTAEDVEQLAA